MKELKMGYIPLVRLCLVKEKEVPYRKTVLNTPEMVAEIVNTIVPRADREYVLVVSLDARKRPIGIEVVAVGKLNAVMVSPRDIFKHCIINSADSLVIAHNHPSGEPEPSEEDWNFTKKMKKVGEFLEIPVLDHVIVGEDGKYVSLQERSTNETNFFVADSL